jgi:hypothetical protein
MSYARKVLAQAVAAHSADKVAASSVLPSYQEDLAYQRALLQAQLDAVDRAAGSSRPRREHNLLQPSPEATRAIVRAARRGPETPYDAHLRLIGSDPDLGAIARSMTAPAVMFSDAYYGDSPDDLKQRQQILAVLQALNGG